MRPVDVDTYSAFVRDCYHAATGAVDWGTVLSDFANMTDAAFVTFSITNMSGTAELFVGEMEPSWMRAYEDHFCTVNPYALLPLSKLMEILGSAKTGEEAIPRSEFVKMEFYNDFQRPQGHERSLSAGLTLSAAGMSTFDVIFGRRDEPVGEEAALVQTLVPHLQTAVALHERLQNVEVERRAVAASLDHMPYGVVVIDRAGHVVEMNSLGQAIVRAQDGLRVDRHVGLHCATPRETQALRTAVQAAGDTARGEGFAGGTVLRVSRPSMARPYEVLVAPLPPHQAGAGLEGVVVLYITDPEREPEPAPARLARLYGLSPVQGLVASFLLEGYSPKEVAFEFEISVATVRAHIRQVLARTGSRNQSELVRRLSGSVAVLEG